MGTLCKTTNSLYTVLFVNERQVVIEQTHFLVLYFCVANLSYRIFCQE